MPLVKRFLPIFACQVDPTVTDRKVADPELLIIYALQIGLKLCRAQFLTDHVCILLYAMQPCPELCLQLPNLSLFLVLLPVLVYMVGLACGCMPVRILHCIDITFGVQNQLYGCFKPFRSGTFTVAEFVVRGNDYYTCTLSKCFVIKF